MFKNVFPYDRRKLQPQIVSLGGSSALFRALFMPLVDKLNELDPKIGVTVLANGRTHISREKFDRLWAQGGCYSVVMRQGIQASIFPIGSITDILYSPDEPRRAVEILADETAPSLSRFPAQRRLIA